MSTSYRISRIAKFLGLAIGLFGILGGFIYYKTAYVALYDFNAKRDSAFILDVFNRHWYWLIAEGSDFSPEYMLEHLASSKDPSDHGNEIIKVMYKGNTPVGFVIYYKKKFYQGVLHFVAVDDQFRSKGYGLQLVEYAVNDLISRGCTSITLVTRTENYAAQKIYLRAGFKETERTNRFVYYKYTVNNKD